MLWLGSHQCVESDVDCHMKLHFHKHGNRVYDWFKAMLLCLVVMPGCYVSAFFPGIYLKLELDGTDPDKLGSIIINLFSIEAFDLLNYFYCYCCESDINQITS